MATNSKCLWSPPHPDWARGIPGVSSNLARMNLENWTSVQTFLNSPCGPRGGLGSIEWDLVIDNDGDWTSLCTNPSGAGTYSYSGGVLTRTDSTAAGYSLIYSAVRLRGPRIIQAEVAISGSAYAGAYSCAVGIGFHMAMESSTANLAYENDHTIYTIGWDGSTDFFHQAAFNHGAGTVDYGTVTDYRYLAAPGDGTWHTLTMVAGMTPYVDCYYDYAAGDDPSDSWSGNKAGECLAFVSYAGNSVKWRNVKAWQASDAWMNYPM